MHPIMEEQEPDSPLQPHRGDLAHELPTDSERDKRFSYQQGNESASSGIDTLPSPILTNEGGTLPQDGNVRRSLFETISPVSPTVGRHWNGHERRG